ncbi:hypothetical protein [Sphingomonas koreensis]
MKLLVGLGGLMLVATPVLAEDWDFILTNASGKPIKTIELAPSGTADWKPQTVDPETKRDPVIKPSARTTIHFDKAANQCRYDLRATFEDTTTQVWSSVNICDNSYITLKLAGGKPTVVVN